MRAHTSSPESKVSSAPEDGSQFTGADMRSLVKQMTEARARDGGGASEGGSSDGLSDQKLEKSRQKQRVRRRLNTTTRPYQERLVDMAEARREIAVALKFHRASMKQRAGEKQRTPPPSRENSVDSQDNRSPAYYRPVSPVPAIQNLQESFNFVLPRQTLGLNLNLESFNFADSAAFQPSPSFSSSASPTAEDIRCDGGLIPFPSMAEETQIRDSITHQAENDSEMKSLGKHHEIKWDDEALNLGNSAEIGGDYHEKDDPVCSLLNEAMEFPPWLNPNEGCSRDLDDPRLDDCLPDPTLPCMEIEEIEEMDGDWLA